MTSPPSETLVMTPESTLNLRPQTALVRGGQLRSEFSETSEALYLTSGYTYPTAEEAEAAFKGENDRYVYSRYRNPTVGMFEERLRLLELSLIHISEPTGPY